MQVNNTDIYQIYLDNINEKVTEYNELLSTLYRHLNTKPDSLAIKTAIEVVRNKIKFKLNKHYKADISKLNLIPMLDTKTAVANLRVFNMLLGIWNDTLNYKLLNGEVINLGTGVGKIQIIKQRREDTSLKLKPHWGKSNSYRRELEAKGIAIYSKTNPTGVKWFIYHTEPYRYIWYWAKSQCKLYNKHIYSMHPMTFRCNTRIDGKKIPMDNLLNDITSKEQIYSLPVGSVQKRSLLCEFDDKHDKCYTVKSLKSN